MSHMDLSPLSGAKISVTLYSGGVDVIAVEVTGVQGAIVCVAKWDFGALASKG